MTGKVGLSYFEKNTPYANFTPIDANQSVHQKEAYGNSDFKKPPDNDMPPHTGHPVLGGHIILCYIVLTHLLIDGYQKGKT